MRAVLAAHRLDLRCGLTGCGPPSFPISTFEFASRTPSGRRWAVAISADIIVRVPDVLIRDVPSEDLARIDAHAARLGLSRTEYLRRRLHQDAARPATPVTVEDLRTFTARFGDLDDPDVMRQAWS